MRKTGSRAGWVALAAALQVSAPQPDDVRAPAPPSSYSPVFRGTKEFVPVEPKPWGAINERAGGHASGTADKSPR